MTLDDLRAWHARIGANIPFDQWMALRFRCQTDLFFLATKVLGYAFTEETHRPVANFYVKKNPHETIANQDTEKNRLHLDPRGTFKTTAIVCDSIQWIIAFPNIRVMDVTANDDLAVATIGEVKDKFIRHEDRERTLFQTLFPEHCIKPTEKGAEDQFWSPAREQFRKEATMWALGVLSTGSGWHCDVGKFDDCVSEKNSETSDQRRKVWERMQLLYKLVDAYGYRDRTGTRYEIDDAYGLEIENSLPGSLKIMCRSAWTVKAESVGKPKDELGAADYDLLFPFDATGTPRLTYEFLRRESHGEKFRSFCSQYLNDPLAARTTKFTEEMLRRCTVPYTMLPKKYQTFQIWDLAYSVEKNRAFSVGVTGFFDSQSRIFLGHIVKGRFSGSELAYQIAKNGQMWKPEMLGIEDSPGARWLGPEIERHAERLSIQLTIDWIKIDKSKFAKANRIWGLEPLMTDGRFFFSAEAENLDDAYRQFIKFTGPTFTGLIDIADAISHLPRYLPRVQADPNSEQSFADVWALLREKELHEAIYGSRTPLELPEPEPVAPDLNSFDIPPDLGGTLQ